MNLQKLALWLLRILLPIPLALLIYRIDSLGLGYILDTMIIPEIPIVWLLITVFRTGVGILLLYIFSDLILKTCLDRKRIILSFISVGLPLYGTWLLMMAITSPFDQPPGTHKWLYWLSPGPILDSIREPIYTWFTTQGYSYTDFLSIYFTWIEPLVVDLPRVLLLILLGYLMAKHPKLLEFNRIGE